MATVEELRLEIKAEVSDAVSKLKQYDRATKDTTTSTTKMQSTFASMRDVMQGPIAAFNMVVGVLRKVGKEVDGMIMNAADFERAQSNLNSVLKATGGIAGMTMESLQALAETMSMDTLFDAADLRQAEAVLLTFKAIGKDIFPSVAMAAADLAQLMGGDLQGAAVMLGKAMQEPVRGVTALRKVGVGLTEDQEKQIKSFMAVNDVASAQAIILKEVQSQLGGTASAAAKTATGTYLNMKKSFDEVNEAMGLIIANSGKDIFQGATDSAYAFIDMLNSSSSEIDAWVQTGKAFFEEYARQFSRIFENINPADLKKISEALRTIIEEITEGMSTLNNKSVVQLGALVKVIADTFTWISQALGGYMDFYTGIFTGDWSKAWEGIQKVVLVFAKNVLGILETVVNAGIKFAQGFIDIYNKVDEKIKILPDIKIKFAPIDFELLNQVEDRLAKLGVGTPRITGKGYNPNIPSAPSGGTLAPPIEGGEDPIDQSEKEIDAVWDVYSAYEERTQLYSSTSQEMYIQLEDYRQEDLEKEKKAQEEKKAAAKAYFDFVASAAENVFSAYMDLEQNKSDATIANLEKQRDAMEENGQDTIAIDEQIRSEKNRIAKKQFDADKINTIARIAMDTAEAVMKAYTIDPTGILSIIVGAAGAAQAGMAASKEYIPMAEGGMGTVTKPTLFLAGEAGPEDFAFGPKRKGGLSGGSTVVNNFYGSPWAIKEAEAMVMGTMTRAGRGY